MVRSSKTGAEASAWQTITTTRLTSSFVVLGYGVMVSGRIRARAIAKTPNSVSAPSPKFQRVRRIKSIEVVRRPIGGSLDVPHPSGQVFHNSSGCMANDDDMHRNGYTTWSLGRRNPLRLTERRCHRAVACSFREKSSAPVYARLAKLGAGAGIRATKGDPWPPSFDRPAEIGRAPIATMALFGSIKGAATEYRTLI
jgi:hypothetical protein